MAKKSRNRKPSNEDSAPGEVGPRQPCPCGSGKRYKACHGAPGGGDVWVARPFEGLPGECDLVALRELVPAATTPLTVSVDGTEHTVRLTSLLPAASPALVHESGQVSLGLQVQHQFGDPSRDLAAVLVRALEHAAAGESGVVGLTAAPGSGPRMQDLVVSDALDITVHDGFDYWVEDVDEEEKEALAAALEQANGAIAPSARLASVEAAYWTDVTTKEHLRWVRPEPEDAVLDALARLHVSGADVIVPDARLVGMFRAHGLLTPVWDLPLGTGAEAVEDPAAEFGAALEKAMADDSPLTPEERSARSGLASRQVSIR